VIETEKINLLIVDDQPANLLALESLLELPDVQIIKASSGNEALGIMLEHDIALVLMDVQMPEMDGFETAEVMRHNSRTRNIPIIFVTAINKEEKHIFKGYDAGAVDYLFKPLDPHILTSKVHVFLELHRNKKSLEKSTRKLQNSIDGLKQANQKIIRQQRAVIEEERLKVLLQMAGATAHELNQPLMGLLGTIELIRLDRHNSAKLDTHLNRIEESGKKISRIVKKIQGMKFLESAYGENSADIGRDRDRKLTIVSVESSETDFSIIHDLLSKSMNITVTRTDSIKDTLTCIHHSPCDLMVIDYFLKDGNGLDLIKQLNEIHMDIPVIMITGKGDEYIATQALQSGAYDYLTKDRLTGNNLTNAIQNALSKSRMKKEAHEAVKKMAEMSIRDALTGLYNRRFFSEALERETARSIRNRTDLVLCIMDLDFFKQINDTMGHQTGDMVLSELGRMLTDWIRQTDIPCRYGGEEFAVILTDTDIEHAIGVCERFRRMLVEYRFQHQEKSFQVTISIGIASLQNLDNPTSETVIQAADQAMYQAKAGGRNRVVVYG
jgi:two-component system cell cycle response regulator